MTQREARRGADFLESDSSGDGPNQDERKELFRHALQCAERYAPVAPHLAKFIIDYTQKGDLAQLVEDEAIDVDAIPPHTGNSPPPTGARRRLDFEPREPSPFDEDHQRARSDRHGPPPSRLSGKRPAKRERSPSPEVPDLLGYLDEFQIPEPEQVKMLRAAANYLTAKDPERNRVRYSNSYQANRGRGNNKYN